MGQKRALNSLFFDDNLDRLASPNRDHFRRVMVEVSKLLVERWQGTPRGKKFDNDVNNAPGGMREALHNAGISEIDQLNTWINVEATPGASQGSLECDESVNPNRGLVFRWKIPFSDKPPESSLPDQLLVAWIEKCDEWLASEKPEDPNEPFPDPDNQNIPLATT